jgi:hypothetical protein
VQPRAIYPNMIRIDPSEPDSTPAICSLQAA